MTTQDAELDALIAFASMNTKAAAEMPGLADGKPVSTGARAAENCADLKLVPGGGIDDKEATRGEDVNTEMALDLGIKQHALDTGNDEHIPVIHYGHGSKDEEKLAAELASLLKQANALDGIVTEAGQSNKAASALVTLTQAEKQAAEYVNFYKIAGETAADQVTAYIGAFDQTYKELAAMHKQGTLKRAVEEAAPPEEDEGGKEDAPPAEEAGAGAGPAADGPPGAPPEAGPPGAGAGGPPQIDEIVHAIIESGINPAELAQALMAAAGPGGPGGAPGGDPGAGGPPPMDAGAPPGAPPMPMPPEKAAQVARYKRAAEVANRVVAIVRDPSYDYAYSAPKSKESAAFRAQTRKYFREMYASARK